VSYNAVERLKNGDIEFINGLTAYDLKTITKSIRESCNRREIVRGFYSKLKSINPEFCFNIIYDMDDYFEEALKLIEEYNYISFNSEKIKNLFLYSKLGKEYIYNNLDVIFSEDLHGRLNFILGEIFNDITNHKDWIYLLSRHSDLHIRAVFMLYVIKKKPDLLNIIYDDFIGYIIGETFEVGEQITLFPNLMLQEDLCEIAYACLESNLDKQIYIKLKECIIKNYPENDLAKKLFDCLIKPGEGNFYRCEKNELGISEFFLDADRLFNTSKTMQFYIYENYSEKIASDIMENFAWIISHYQNENIPSLNRILDNLFSYGLGNKLKLYTEKYLSFSEDKTSEHLGNGSTCSCFRIGDYVIKLVQTKWSFEEIICPRNYLIIKNYEEDLIRNNRGIIIAGLEVQKYLKRSAKDLEPKHFAQFSANLSASGYYITDTLIGGPCGDNCRLLDSYKDADYYNPELLPSEFKEVPLVLVDRDRVYSLSNKHPKQLRESMS